MVIKNDLTRNNVLKGAEILYDAVRTTFGPKGHNVLLKDKFGTFHITHDGVTVAKAVKSDDLGIQVGIDLIKEASKKMESVGDGTTSVTILTYNLIKEFGKLIKRGYLRKAASPMLIRKVLESSRDQLLKDVDNMSMEVEKTFDGVYNVATISCEDAELAKIIAELVVGTGYEGAINVETRVGEETTAELVSGYLFPNGYISAHFMTDESSKECVLNDPQVILVNGKMDSVKTYISMLEKFIADNKKDILFVCSEIDNDLLSILLLNKIKGQFNACVVKNQYGYEYLADLNSVVGGEIYSPTLNNNLPDDSNIGHATRIVVSDKELIVFSDEERRVATQLRIKNLTSQNIKNKDEQVEHRIALLNGRVGLIKVGGLTEMEAKEKKDRIDDAVAATRAALKGGIVAGGGVTLDNLFIKDCEPINKALHSLRKILMENSGIKLKKKLPYPLGQNVVDGKVVNMFIAGIVDPTIVVKETINNAFSIAGIALTVGGSIVDEPISREELKDLMSV